MKKDRNVEEKPASFDLQQRYRPIVETGNEGIWEINQEARTVFVNQRMADMLGYTVEEMLGCSAFEYLFPEDQPEAEKRRESANQSKFSRSTEFRYRRKDGSVLWAIVSRIPKLDTHGNVIGSFAMFSDITEQKRNEERLREQAEELLASWAHIFEHVDWGIATIFQDRFVMVNPAFANMHGYRVEELIGHSIFDVLAPESHTYTSKQIRMTYEKGHHVYENIHLRKDGSTFPGFVDSSIIRDSQGKVLYRAVSVQDITERKQAEKALNESHQRLRQLSRRLIEVQEEERRALTRELHDRVGQILSALKLDLTLIQDEMPPSSMQGSSTRLQDAWNLVDEMTKLVRDLLNDLRPAVLDDYGLKAAFQAYLEEFTARYNIPVALEIAREPDPRLDSSLEITLLRIAQEALTNVARHAQAGHATLSLRLESNAVCLTVLDDGIGMDASKKEAHRISHGLKIMHERAEAFGGTVTVLPVEERGTKVEVVIPQAPGVG